MHFRFNLFEGDACEVRKKYEIVFRVMFKPILEEPPVDGIVFTHITNLATLYVPGTDKQAIVEIVRRKYKLPKKSLTSKKSTVVVWTMVFMYEKVWKTRWILPILSPILNRSLRIFFDWIHRDK